MVGETMPVESPMKEIENNNSNTTGIENAWTLTIYFEDDKVIDVKLRLPSMMT